LDKKRASLNNSVERATSYYSRNSVAIDWESLGCDWLMLDEAHCSKNIWFPTKITGTAGITNVDTQRSLNTLMKFRYLWESGGFIGGGTGTWPSNSISEMFNLMRLFAPDELQRTQTEHFDSWLGQFGETKTNLEFTSTGGIKSKTRVSSYKNLWELMSLLSIFTDFATAEGVGVERPILHRHTLTAPPNPTQLAINQNIKIWMEGWQRKQGYSYLKADGKLVEHNPLTLTNLGSLSSVDPRLVDPDAEPFLETKLHKLIHNCWWIYRATADKKGTQLIFSDSGTPKNRQRFDCYNYIRDTLVALGVPENEICFASTENTSRLVPAPMPALYTGAESTVVEYIRGLGEPTATDADGNRITWIEQMEPLVLKPDVTHQRSIEEAREQLERTLSDSVEATTDKVRELNVQLCAMRQVISTIGLSEAATDRVMERLNTQLKLELGVMSQDDGGYLWETVDSGKQGRLF
jgi:hypothetical protein